MDDAFSPLNYLYLKFSHPLSLPKFTSRLTSLKMQPPTPSPHPLPIDLQNNNNPKNRRTNRSLHPKTNLRARLLRPSNLHITNNKAPQRARLVQPSANLTAAFRVRIQIVAGER